MQFLKEETLGYLNITSPYEPKICKQEQKQKEEACHAIASAATAQEEALDPRAIQDVESKSSLIREILDFDQAQREKCFNSKMYLCDICFSEKLGSECMNFMDCSHVYCKVCLKDYFEIQIRDGQVHCLTCPGSECSSVATPGQVTFYKQSIKKKTCWLLRGLSEEEKFVFSLLSENSSYQRLGNNLWERFWN